jgi:hypothetical protein
VCFEVDGKPVGALSEIMQYLQWGGPFPYTVDPADPKIGLPPQYGANNFNVPEGSDREIVAWSWVFMLKPLSPGEHEIGWVVTPSIDGFDPRGVTKYQVTVE